MLNLNLINNGQVNHLVLKTILENEEPEMVDQIIPEPTSYTAEVTENGILYKITFTDSLWAEILQNGTEYTLVGLS